MAVKLKTCRPIICEAVHKPADIVDQHLDQNMLKRILCQIKRDNMRNNYTAAVVLLFCTNLTAYHFVAKGSRR